MQRMLKLRLSTPRTFALTVSISSFNIHIHINPQGLDFSDDDASNKNKKGPNKSSRESQVKQKKVRKIGSKQRRYCTSIFCG